MRIKPVFRYDRRAHMVRLFRLLFKRGYSGPGYGAKLSFAIWPKVFRFTRAWHEFEVTLLGFRVHWRAANGVV